MFVRQKVPLTSPPRPGDQVDWSNPINQGLRAWSVGSGVVVANGGFKAFTLSGSAEVNGGVLSLPSTGSYAQVDSMAGQLSAEDAVGSGFSLTVAFRTGASLTNQILLAAGTNTDGSRSTRIMIASATSLQWLVASTTGSWLDDTKTIPSLAANTDYVLTARYLITGYSSALKNISINGVTTAFTTYPTYPAHIVQGGLWFGHEAALAGYDFVGKVYGFLNHGRYLSDREVRELAINPSRGFV